MARYWNEQLQRWQQIENGELVVLSESDEALGLAGPSGPLMTDHLVAAEAIGRAAQLANLSRPDHGWARLSAPAPLAPVVQLDNIIDEERLHARLREVSEQQANHGTIEHAKAIILEALREHTPVGIEWRIEVKEADFGRVDVAVTRPSPPKPIRTYQVGDRLEVRVSQNEWLPGTLVGIGPSDLPGVVGKHTALGRVRFDTPPLLTLPYQQKALEPDGIHGKVLLRDESVRHTTRPEDRCNCSARAEQLPFCYRWCNSHQA